MANETTPVTDPVSTKVTAKITAQITSEKQKKINLDLVDVEKAYARSATIKMKVTKTLHLKMLDQKKVYSGSMILKRPGLLRLEFDKPEKSVAVVTPKKFVLIQYPAEQDAKDTSGFRDTVIRVTQSTNPKRIQSQHLVALLMGKGSILTEFKLNEKNVSKQEDLAVYKLKPKSQNSDIKTIEIQIVAAGNTAVIQSISYTDQLDNVTELKFEEVKFGKKIKSSYFDLKIPKDAEVTEI